MSVIPATISVSKKKKNSKDKKKSEDGVSKKSKKTMKKQKAVSPKKELVVKSVDSAEAVLSKSILVSDELKSKNMQDERTIYIKFKENRPSTTEEIKELHPDIKFVRNPLLSKKTTTTKGIHYAFLEFETAELCKNALTKLATTQFKGEDVFVDAVGENSKHVKKDSSDNKEINPMRLFVVGLPPGMTKSGLKEMFPKAAHADVPSTKSQKNFGFVQFSNAKDAKDAFDAGQNLSIDSHKITVLFAKKSASKGEVKRKKAEKRKAKKPGSAAKMEGGLVKKEGDVVKKEGGVVKKDFKKIKTKKVNKVKK